MKDTSIFRGVVQFTDSNGNEYRVFTDWGIKNFYKRRLGDSAFVKIGSVQTKAKTASGLYKAGINAGIIN